MFDNDCECGQNCPPCEDCEMPECECFCNRGGGKATDDDEDEW